MGKVEKRAYFIIALTLSLSLSLSLSSCMQHAAAITVT
jgi:hypothetical protein